MNKRLFLFLSLILLSTIGFSQTPIGIWKNIDDEDGKAKSHIEIYEENGKLHGKVIKLLEEADIIFCKKCKDHRKDQAILGMIIMNDLIIDDQGWSGGEILDPKSGKTYKCSIELDGNERLNVRGYIGIPVFGRTQVWHRVDISKNG